MLFDKSPVANRGLGLHLDTTISLRQRASTDGYSAASMKGGAVHAVASRSVMESPVAFRVHVYACDASNDPVEAVPGSNREETAEGPQIACVGPFGRAVVFSH